MSITLSPIGPWPLVALACLAVMGLTIWAYRARLRNTTGRWRWVALGLRLAAVLLCFVAAVRPSVMIDEKKKQQSVVIFLIDSSGSMALNDEINGQTRWAVARKALDEAKKAIEGKSKELEVRTFRFDSDVREDNKDDVKPPDGRETALGPAMLKVVKEALPLRVASIILLADGASNAGTSPLTAATELRAKQVPVVTVGVGTPDAGKDSRDISAKDLVAGPTVFVKNRPEIRGTIGVRGFANQTIEVELLVEDKVVDSKMVKVPEGVEVIPVTGFKYIPETPGEKRVTLRVKLQDKELITTNNEVSTYLDVLKGGLNVLYVQGPDFSWDPHYLIRALDAAREIHTDFKIIREPALGRRSGLDDADFAPGQYDVYLFAGFPAANMTREQISALVKTVEKGAGLIMLGGRSSFGSGGWASTELARILPVNISPSDGDIDYGESGRKVTPNTRGLENYVLRLAPTPGENAKIWASLPPIMGANRFGLPKPSAFVLAEAERDPVMIGMDDVGKGRVLVFGGETWHWARTFQDESRLAYARFWRQAVLWLARRENKGEDQVKLKLDARRVPLGQKLELTATARDSKNESIADVKFETTVTKLDAKGKPEGKAEPVPIYPQGEDEKGPYFAQGLPGEYLATLKAVKNGAVIGTDQARFMVYQDDRELENPAADLALLKQIAVTTGGASLRSEELTKYLKALGPEVSEYTTQTETKLWDNWPFFLHFVALLTAEWALRKAKGWV